MKVLQFITRLDLGGAQELCLDLCRALLARGHEVHLLTGTQGELLDDARRIPGLALHLWEDWHHAVRPLADLRCQRRLRGLLRAERFDVLHTHSSKAGLIGRLAAAGAGAPPHVMHHVHGWSFNDAQGALARTAFVLLERRAAKPGFLLIACSRATDAQGRRERIGRDADRRVVVNGIDRQIHLVRRPRAAIRRRLGVGARDVVFLQLGNLKPQKDPVSFARAAVSVGRDHPRARFLIAGDGPLRAEAERVAAAGGIAGRFGVLGWRRDVPELLAAADVLVLTSRFEGLPIAVLRGMTAGLPVVATAVDGTPEAVRDGSTGFVVPPGDPGAIAAAMGRLAADPRARAGMGRRGRLFSKEFGLDRVIAETLRHYPPSPLKS